MANTRTPVTGRKVQLMATCLCDAFYDDVARATVEVLEHLGCEVEFPEGQTCCGQPAFNSGDWDASRKIMRHTVKTFSGNVPVVIPSGSCAAMLFHGAPMEFEKEADAPAVQASRESHVGAGRFHRQRARHHAMGGPPGGECRVSSRLPYAWHGERPGGAATPRVDPGLHIAAFGEAEQCCGFGGTFSVAFPHISGSMGRLKLEHVMETHPDFLVSGDMSCLMHLSGLANKEGKPLQIRHIAQVLRDALTQAP